SWRSAFETSAGRFSIRICSRSKDLGERCTGRLPSSSSRVAESNSKGPKRILIANLRNPYGFPVTRARAPRHSNGCVRHEDRAMTQTGKAPTGLSIWKAIREELTANLYPLPYTTLPPTVFYVYLHPADYDRIEGILS